MWETMSAQAPLPTKEYVYYAAPKLNVGFFSKVSTLVQRSVTYPLVQVSSYLGLGSSPVTAQVYSVVESIPMAVSIAPYSA